MIEQAVHSALSAASGVKVWALQASDKAAPPFAVYARSSTETEGTFGTDDAVVYTYEVVVIDDSYSGARRIADRLASELADFKGTVDRDTVLEAYLEEDSDGDPIELPGDEKPWFSVSQTWKVITSKRKL